MSYPSEPMNLVSRYADCEPLTLEGRVSPSMPITTISRSPESSPSWDISSESSTESGFVPDSRTVEHIPEPTGFGGMFYDHAPNSQYHRRWEFSDPADGPAAPPRLLGQQPAGVPVVGPSPPHIGPRGEFARPLARQASGNEEISYTDEANTKLSNRIRRRCFNCKATETSTWRRSVLSPGKLLCNKCGLFERTHAIPRPQKFPRRRTHSSKIVRTTLAHPDMRTPPGGGFVNRHSTKEPGSQPLPITTHLLHALDPISGEIFPQHVPWNSSDAPGSASPRVNRYPNNAEQPAMYHSNGQLPSTVLPGTIWI